MSFDVLGELVQLGWVSFLGFALMFFPCFFGFFGWALDLFCWLFVWPCF